MLKNIYEAYPKTQQAEIKPKSETGDEARKIC